MADNLKSCVVQFSPVTLPMGLRCRRGNIVPFQVQVLSVPSTVSSTPAHISAQWDKKKFIPNLVETKTLMHIVLAEVTKENQVSKESKWGQRDVQHLKEILSRH